MNSTDLNVRLTEILTSNETLEARFEALAELQAEALLQLPLSQRPRDPALVWDAVIQALTELAAARALPGNPSALLNQIVRRRVQDVLRREMRAERWQTPLVDEEGELDPDAERAHALPPETPQFTDSYDRILRVVDRLCAGVRPHSREGWAYRLLQRLLLDGASLDIAELRFRAVEAGLNPTAMNSALKRFRRAVRSGIHRDPELQSLLNRMCPPRSSRPRNRPRTKATKIIRP